MFAEADALLRAEGSFAVGNARLPWLRFGALVGVSGVFYGAVMGAFQGRELQALYAALKVPLLLGVAFSVCLPNFFVMNAVFGLRADFAAACRGLLCAQGTLALCLASFAPVTALAYSCEPSYPFALLLNALTFAVASLAAQLTLARHYRPLIARDSRHKLGLAAWLLLYTFVAIKVASLLRPFVGDPRVPTEFFREKALDENPYTSLLWTALALAAKAFRAL